MIFIIKRLRMASMNENEKNLPQKDRKSKIRERYKGIDEELLDVIPAVKQK